MLADVTASNPYLSRTLSTASVSRRSRARSAGSKRSGDDAVSRFVAEMPHNRTRAPLRLSDVVEGQTEELARGAVELGVETRRGVERPAAGDGMEVVVAKLERHRAGQQSLVPQLRGDACGKQREEPLEAGGVPLVARHRRFPAHRAREAVGAQCRSPVAVRPELECLGVVTHEALELGWVHPLDLHDVHQPELGPPRRCPRPDPGERRHGEAGQESLLPSGPHLHQSAGLGEIRRQLGDHAVGADSDAAVEPRRGPHRVPEPLGDRQQRAGIELLGPPEIEVGLVERRHDDGG